MKMLHYIKGDRKGEDAREIELASLQDVFLSEALDGYNAHPGYGAEHARDVLELERAIVKRTFIRRRGELLLAIVAAGILLVAVVFFLLVGKRGTESVRPGPVKSETVIPEENKTSGGDMGGHVAAGSAAVTGNPADANLKAGENITTVDPSVKTTENGVAAYADTTARNADAMLFEILPPSADETDELPEGKKYFSRPKVGLRTFNEYLGRAMVMPEGVSPGNVTISFRVNAYGRPSSIRIEESYDQDAGREAIRLLDGGPEWYPTDKRVAVTIFFR